jgi:hypothetical protein
LRASWLSRFRIKKTIDRFRKGSYNAHVTIKFLNIVVLIFILLPGSVIAGEADVVAVDVQKSGDNTYHFEVTVSHTDEGWEHYADGWDILDPDGNVLGTRTLYHPHVNEQPFTRSLSGVKIPGEVKQVTVRAHDSVHKYGGMTKSIVLPE